jgi:hypothetical protein
MITLESAADHTPGSSPCTTVASKSWPPSTSWCAGRHRRDFVGALLTLTVIDFFDAHHLFEDRGSFLFDGLAMRASARGAPRFVGSAFRS